jgi:hypothetical protein
MELEDIKRAALKQRRFEVVAGPATFALLVPTKLESTLAYTGATRGGALEGVAMLRFQRDLVLQAVVGWSGVTLGHVLGEVPEAAEALAWEPGAVALVLDANPAWEEAATVALVARMTERRAAWDTAAKN